MKGDVSGGMRWYINHLGLDVAQLDHIPAAHMHIKSRDALGLCCRSSNLATSSRLDLRIAADMVGVPMRVPDLRDRPPPRLGSRQNRRGDRRIDHQRLTTLRFMHQPDIIVRKDGDANDLKHVYHAPTLGMLTHGSAGARCPSCNNSIEMPSGVRTKAICPSRGGRLMVMPASISRWHVA